MLFTNPPWEQLEEILFQFNLHSIIFIPWFLPLFTHLSLDLSRTPPLQVTIIDYMMKILAKERYASIYPDDPQAALRGFATFMGYFGQVRSKIHAHPCTFKKCTSSQAKPISSSHLRSIPCLLFYCTLTILCVWSILKLDFSQLLSLISFFFLLLDHKYDFVLVFFIWHWNGYQEFRFNRNTYSVSGAHADLHGFSVGLSEHMGEIRIRFIGWFFVLMCS